MLIFVTTLSCLPLEGVQRPKRARPHLAAPSASSASKRAEMNSCYFIPVPSLGSDSAEPSRRTDRKSATPAGRRPPTPPPSHSGFRPSRHTLSGFGDFLPQSVRRSFCLLTHSAAIHLGRDDDQVRRAALLGPERHRGGPGQGVVGLRDSRGVPG